MGKIEHTEFTETLQRLVAAHGLRQADVARGAWLSESYIARLLSGERPNPKRDIVIRVGIGLQLVLPEYDELLLAADYRSLAQEYALTTLQ